MRGQAVQSIHCVTGTYEGIRYGASKEKALVRVKADGRALFCRPNEFVDPLFFERLPKGAAVFMGVQSFPDSTFWLHWLHSPQHGTLEPERPYGQIKKGMLCILAGLGGVILAGVAFYLTFFIADLGIIAGIAGFLAMLGGIIAVACFCYGVHKLLVASNARMRRLREWLDLAKKGDTATCVNLKDLAVSATEDGGLGKILSEARESAPKKIDKPLYMADGKVDVVTARSVQTGSGKHVRYFIQYHFSCAGRLVAVTIPDDSSYLHGIFQKSHPFMLAEDDQVRLVVAEDGRTVKAMRNFEDGCAYTFGVGISKNKAQRFVRILWWIPLLLVGGFMLMFFMDYGINAYALERMREPVIIGVGASLGMIALATGIIWLVRFFAQNFGTYHDDIRLIANALELEKSFGKSRPYLHEL